MIGVFVQLNEHTRYAKSRPIGYVICENGCWEWVGTVLISGYSQFSKNGRLVSGHRMVYELHRGPIPKGLQLDHLCRNRACVNPDHLEVVTQRENVLRGVGHTARNAAKTHCHNGHPFDVRNTLKTKRGRDCRACNLEKRRRYKRVAKSKQEPR